VLLVKMAADEPAGLQPQVAKPMIGAVIRIDKSDIGDFKTGEISGP